MATWTLTASPQNHVATAHGFQVVALEELLERMRAWAGAPVGR